MTYRVKVTGPSARRAPFGSEIHIVASPADVTVIDGVLLITTPPYEGRKAHHDLNRPSVSVPARKATRGSQIAYPAGGWDRVVVTDYIDEEEPRG